MVNRFNWLLDQYEETRKQIELGRNLKPTNPIIRQLGTLALKLKQLIHRINTYGQGHKIVKVIVRLTYDGIPETWEVYFTGIEEFEAISYVKFKLSKYHIHEINAHSIPVGKPIK
jgi:hypothetical protein